MTDARASAQSAAWTSYWFDILCVQSFYYSKCADCFSFRLGTSHEGSSLHSHWRQAVQVRGLWKGFQPKGQPPTTPAYTWR